MYWEVSVSHEKAPSLRQNQNIGSFPYPRTNSNPRHFWSHDSLDNRNVIVNVQVMGKKQEIIYLKDPGYKQRNPRSNNYVLACSDDRESQTHRDNSKDKMLSYDYNTNQKNKHK